MIRNNSSIFVQFKRLLGALRSGHPAAYMGLLLKSISPFSQLIDQIMHKAIDEKPQNSTKSPPCIMIVSPPRSGSTIIYQVLVRVIPSVYISNLHLLFPYCASRYMVKRKRFGSITNSFDNYYGYTSNLYDVNEGNQIVEKLLKSASTIEEIRENFNSFIHLMKSDSERPLIFKNVRFYSRIYELHKFIPEITFLRIKRDIEEVVQSVVRAYHELGTFHPTPAHLKNKHAEDYIEFAVKQIIAIEESLESQKQKINPKNWIEWTYEDFCSNPLPMIENLADLTLNFEKSVIRKDAIPFLRASKNNKVDKREAQRISMLISKKKLKVR